MISGQTKQTLVARSFCTSLTDKHSAWSAREHVTPGQVTLGRESRARGERGRREIDRRRKKERERERERDIYI